MKKVLIKNFVNPINALDFSVALNFNSIFQIGELRKQLKIFE